eukprot:4403376-Prymnesium_polylepis.1
MRSFTPNIEISLIPFRGWRFTPFSRHQPSGNLATRGSTGDARPFCDLRPGLSVRPRVTPTPLRLETSALHVCDSRPRSYTQTKKQEKFPRPQVPAAARPLICNSHRNHVRSGQSAHGTGHGHTGTRTAPRGTRGRAAGHTRTRPTWSSPRWP